VRRSKTTRFLSALLLAIMCCSAVMGQSSGRVTRTVQRKPACTCGCAGHSCTSDPILQLTDYLGHGHGCAKATDHCSGNSKSGCGCKFKAFSVPVHLPAVLAPKSEHDERYSISSISISDLPLIKSSLAGDMGDCFHKILEQSSSYGPPTITSKGTRAPPA